MKNSFNKLSLITILLMGFLTASGQYGFRRSTQIIEKGNYFLVYQKSSIRDCDNNSYHKLHTVKAEISDIEAVGKYVTTFNLYHVNHFTHGLSWTWDDQENPVAFSTEGGSVFLYPYNGNIYLLSDSFYEDVYKIGSSTYGGVNSEICITGWLQKKKPKAVDDGKNKASVECPVTIEELKEDAMKTMQKRIEKDSIKFPSSVSIEGKSVSKYDLRLEWQNNEGSYSDASSSLKVGIIAVLEDGTTLLTNNFEEGFGLYSDYIVNVYGGCLESTKRVDSKGEYYERFHFNKTAQDKQLSKDEDFLKISVINKSTGEEVVNEKVPLEYYSDVTLDYSNPDGSYCSDGWDGGEIDIEVEELEHSETGEPLLYYTITINNYYKDGKKAYIKMPKTGKLTIYNDGGNGGDCNGDEYKKGGNAGTFIVHNQTDEALENLELIARDGREGGFGYPPSDYYSSSSDSKYSSSSNSSSDNNSSEIIIINNTGKGVCIVQGGTSQTIGSKEEFDCDDDIYYGVMNGNNCTSSKGAKIADADGDCGKMITLE
ncbi:MAG: hypothetical protein H6599_03685 [Flavobacteriales bacterium]|nr:hypothetical protein [Flavobacteriales bacterium]